MTNVNAIGGLGKPTPSDMNVTYATAGISALSTILSAYQSSKIFKKQVELDTQARVTNMNNLVTSFKYNQYKIEEQYRALDSAFADKVSERTLEGMKEITRAKAIQAETGAGGTSSYEAIQQNIVDEVFDIAVINNERRKALSGLLSEQEQLKMQTEAELTKLALPKMESYNSTWVAGLSGATSALGGMLRTMPPSVTAEVFGFNISSDMNGEIVATNTKPL